MPQNGYFAFCGVFYCVERSGAVATLSGVRAGRRFFDGFSIGWRSFVLGFQNGGYFCFWGHILLL